MVFASGMLSTVAGNGLLVPVVLLSSWLYQINRGFQLRVTWANIDRSNGNNVSPSTLLPSSRFECFPGFLSGYDRSSFGQDDLPLIQPAPLPSITSIQPKSIGIGVDTSTIVASNIPTSLFPATEIDILFKPFGLIKSIQLIPPGPPLNHPLATLAPASPLAQTAIVTYEKAGDAIAARNTLHGQVYEGFGLAVGFVSNLGKDEQQRQGTYNPINCEFPTSAPTTGTISHYGFDGGHFSSQAVTLTQEENFRGLPVDSYDALQLHYMNNFSPARSSYSHWLPCPPFMSHTPNFKPQDALHSLIPYDEPAAWCVINLYYPS